MRPIPKVFASLLVSASVVAMILGAATMINRRREGSVHSWNSRVRLDERVLGEALEKYHEDHASYPTFLSGLSSLTTPTAYIQSLPSDPYLREMHKPDQHPRPYSYYTDPKFLGWIVWSAGPDKNYDLTDKNISSLYDPESPQPSNTLLLYSYEPSNGTISGGDLFRTK